MGIATPVLLGNDPDQLKDLQGVFCNHPANPQPGIESRIYRTMRIANLSVNSRMVNKSSEQLARYQFKPTAFVPSAGN